MFRETIRGGALISSEFYAGKMHFRVDKYAVGVNNSVVSMEEFETQLPISNARYRVWPICMAYASDPVGVEVKRIIELSDSDVLGWQQDLVPWVRKNESPGKLTYGECTYFVDDVYLKQSSLGKYEAQKILGFLPPPYPPYTDKVGKKNILTEPRAIVLTHEKMLTPIPVSELGLRVVVSPGAMEFDAKEIVGTNKADMNIPGKIKLTVGSFIEMAGSQFEVIGFVPERTPTNIVAQVVLKDKSGRSKSIVQARNLIRGLYQDISLKPDESRKMVELVTQETRAIHRIHEVDIRLDNGLKVFLSDESKYIFTNDNFTSAVEMVIESFDTAGVKATASIKMLRYPINSPEYKRIQNPLEQLELSTSDAIFSSDLEIKKIASLRPYLILERNLNVQWSFKFDPKPLHVGEVYVFAENGNLSKGKLVYFCTRSEPLKRRFSLDANWTEELKIFDKGVVYAMLLDSEGNMVRRDVREFVALNPVSEEKIAFAKVKH